MDRGDDEVEGRQQFVGIVHLAIGKNIGLNAFKDSDSGQLPLHGRDLGALCEDAVFLETTGVERRLAVIRDSDVPIAQILRCHGHRLHSGRAVAVERVIMKDALHL